MRVFINAIGPLRDMSRLLSVNKHISACLLVKYRPTLVIHLWSGCRDGRYNLRVTLSFFQLTGTIPIHTSFLDNNNV
jgi:hypothetical protein